MEPNYLASPNPIPPYGIVWLMSEPTLDWLLEWCAKGALHAKLDTGAGLLLSDDELVGHCVSDALDKLANGESGPSD